MFIMFIIINIIDIVNTMMIIIIIIIISSNSTIGIIISIITTTSIPPILGRGGAPAMLSDKPSNVKETLNCPSGNILIKQYVV